MHFQQNSANIVPKGAGTKRHKCQWDKSKPYLAINIFESKI